MGVGDRDRERIGGVLARRVGLRQKHPEHHPDLTLFGMSGAANPIAWAIRHASISGRMGWYDGVGLLDSGLSVALGETATVGLTYDGPSGRYSWFKNGTAGATVTV